MQVKENSRHVEVSFIVIAYNAEQTIRRCVETLLIQDVDKEIILVDNNSTDGTAKEIRDFPVNVLFEPKRCRGTARNRGLEIAIGRYIVFVDADVELPLDWAGNALCLLGKHPEVVAVGGSGLRPGNSWVSRAMDALQYGNQPDCEQKYVSSLATMDIMYRGDRILHKRFADFWTAEDAEFNFGLAEEGWRFLWCRNLSVTHHHVSFLGQLLSKSFLYGMWFLAPYWRHPRMITTGVLLRVLYLPLIIILDILGIVWPVMFGASVLVILLPVFVYTYVAFRSRLITTLREKLQFVLVHSVKQSAQMVGIWAGALNGTWRAFGK